MLYKSRQGPGIIHVLLFVNCINDLYIICYVYYTTHTYTYTRYMDKEGTGKTLLENNEPIFSLRYWERSRRFR